MSHNGCSGTQRICRCRCESLVAQFLAQRVGRQPAFLTTSVHMTQKTGLLSTSWGHKRCAEDIDARAGLWAPQRHFRLLRDGRNAALTLECHSLPQSIGHRSARLILTLVFTAARLRFRVSDVFHRGPSAVRDSSLCPAFCLHPCNLCLHPCSLCRDARAVLMTRYMSASKKKL